MWFVCSLRMERKFSIMYSNLLLSVSFFLQINVFKKVFHENRQSNSLDTDLMWVQTVLSLVVIVTAQMVKCIDEKKGNIMEICFCIMKPVKCCILTDDQSI